MLGQFVYPEWGIANCVIPSSCLCNSVPLLQLHLQVNSQDLDGWSALHVACYYGASTLVDILLKRGAQVCGVTGSVVCGKRWYLLCLATESGHSLAADSI
jgi:ankyrin repeat protein